MIIIDEAVSKLLKQKRIDSGDVETAVTEAERRKLYFESDDGTRICALHLDNLSYWVSYMPEGADSFAVKSAYFHRMKFEEAP